MGWSSLLSRRKSRLAIFAIALAAASAAPASACSPMPGYVRPSNYELVQLAEAIAIGTAVRETGGSPLPGVEFSIDSSLKGRAPARFIHRAGRIGDSPASNSADLPEPHPHAMHGMCNRTTFRVGARYLLFLGRTAEGAWHQLVFPFSRVNEDYAEDDAWTKAVRRYVRLQARYGQMEQLAALKTMLESGTDPSAGRLSRPELADIEAHLTLLSPYKPTAYLLEAWRQLERSGPPASPDREGTILAAPVADALLNPEGGESTRVHWKRFLLGSLVTGNHPDAAPLLESLIADRRTDPRLIGPVLRFLAKNGRYARAFEWLEQRLLAVLPTLERYDAQTLIFDVVLLQTGDLAGSAGKEPWRSDPHAAAAWPELALALYWHQVRFLDREPRFGFQDAIAEIPIADYRARPLVTLALADSYGESKVSQWAIAELDDESVRQAWERRKPDNAEIEEDPAYLPLRVLVSVRRQEHEQALARIFCQSEARRQLLITLLGRHGHRLYSASLDRVAATPGLSSRARELLAGAMVHFSVGEERPSEDLHWSFGDRVTKRIDAAMARSAVRAEPIACPV